MLQTEWKRRKARSALGHWLKNTQRWHDGEKTGTGDLASYFLLLWGNILASSNSTHQQLRILFQEDHVTRKALGNWQLLGLLIYFPIYIYFVISIRIFFLTCYCAHYCCPLLWGRISHIRSSVMCMAYETIATGTTWITKSNGIKDLFLFQRFLDLCQSFKVNCQCKERDVKYTVSFGMEDISYIHITVNY